MVGAEYTSPLLAAHLRRKVGFIPKKAAKPARAAQATA